MNSFRFLEQGVNAEIERQIALLEAGEPVVQETLHFDPATRAAQPAALQGGGARLPLLPRARPAAASAPREEMLAAARAALPELPAERAARYERDWGLAAGRRAAARVRAAVGRLLRGGRGRRATARTARAAANWVTELRARLGAEADPARPRSRRTRWPGSSAWSRPRRSPPARRARCSTSSSPTAATRPRSSSARAWARWAAATSWRPIVGRGDRRQPRRRREGPRAATRRRSARSSAS